MSDPDALTRLSPLGQSRLARLTDARLYLCTDARRERGDLLEFAAAALAGGVDLLQLRDKGSPGEQQFGALEAREELELLGELRALTRTYGALLAVNDRADIAALASADVLHVGQGDLAPAAARRIVGDDALIGLSSHDAGQAGAAAVNRNVDYFCVGPCWPTPTKPGRSAPGLSLVRAAAERDRTAAPDPTHPPTPWFAIGGINTDRLPEVIAAGATRAVVVRAITEANDPEAAARELRAALVAA